MSVFSLESITQNAPATIRVKFTQNPKAVDGGASNDALNATLYSIAGASANHVTNCGTVYGDPASIDLFLSAALAPGAWVLAANPAIIAADGTSFTAPFSLSFTASAVIESPLNRGATNDAARNVIRKFLNPYLKGDGWDAMIDAIAAGETINWDNAKLAFDQLFTSSASGLYLDRRAADNGIQKPINIGMPDELFRQYTIRLTNGKITQQSLLELLEIFYGQDAVRANSTSVAVEPYVMGDGYDLWLLLDEQVEVHVVFDDDDFAITGQATAIEIATAITNACRVAGTTAFAVPYTDPTTEEVAVKIYSGSLGLGSSVRVTRGQAQNVLKFSEELAILNTVGWSATWTVTVNAATGRTRFFTPSTFVNLGLLREGDYVNIYGTEFNVDNKGSFPVAAVYWGYVAGVPYQWFEVDNADGFAQVTAQASTSSILYFRPTRATIHTTSGRSVVVAQPIGTEVDIVLPATSQAVGRSEGRAAYAQVQDPLTISSLTRNPLGLVTVTSAAHGLATNDHVIIDGVMPSTTAPTITAPAGGNSAYGPISLVSLAVGAMRTIYGGAQLLKNDDVLVFGGQTYQGGGTASNDSEQFHAVPTVISPGVTRYAMTWPNFISNLGGSRARFGYSYWDDGTSTGRVWLSGGSDGTNAAANTFRYSVGAWTAGPALITARAGHKQSTISTTKIFVTGGANAALNAVLATCEYTDADATGVWAARSSMTEARCDHEQILLSTGQVLVVGGRTLASGGIFDWTTSANIGTVLPTIELYTPGANTWTTSPHRMSVARFGHQLQELPSGRVLIMGGRGYNPTQGVTSAVLRSCEIWDPVTGRCSPGPTMNYARSFFASGRILSGTRVVVAGGVDADPWNDPPVPLEYLDVAEMKWRLSPAVLSGEFAIGVVRSDDSMLLTCGAWDEGQDLDDQRFYIPSSESWYGNNLNGQHKITVTGANTFTFETPEQANYALANIAGMTATAVASLASNLRGPFTFDPQSGVAITGTKTTLTTALSKGHRYNKIVVADASDFPDEDGWLVLAFGYEGQVAPVRYFGRMSDTELAIDVSFRMPSNVAVGATVTLLHARGPYTPDGHVAGAFYLTDSPAGRIAASQAVDAAVAAGVTVNKTVVYPGDRGLGGEGYPASGNYKVSDKVAVWGGNEPDQDMIDAREDEDG